MAGGFDWVSVRGMCPQSEISPKADRHVPPVEFEVAYNQQLLKTC